MAVGDLLSKMVTQRRRLGDRLSRDLARDASLIAKGLERSLGALLFDGEAMPRIDLLVQLLGREMEVAVQHLDLAGIAHSRELGSAKGERRRLEKARQVLYSEVVEIRRAAVGLWGTEDARDMFGFAGRTPRDVATLGEQVGFLFHVLVQADQLPPTKTGAPGVDPDVWLATLRPLRERFETARQRVDQVVLGVEETRYSKRLALADFDDVMARVLGFYLVLLELAGESERASQRRREYRRPHRAPRPKASSKAPRVGETWDAARSLWTRARSRLGRAVAARRWFGSA